MSRTRDLLLLLAVAFLAGCQPTGDDGSGPLVAKPAALHPEQDAFALRATRTYLWKEHLRREGGKDSLLSDLSLQATRGADSILPGDTLLRVDFAPMTYEGPVAAAVVARLGFRPGRLLLDTDRVPDPGPDLAFPETPALGWRLDTTMGALHFVRELRGVEVVKLSGKHHQCWAFAETTWHADTLRGTGSTWMGREGLVLHRSEWANLALSSGASGTLFRQITAP